MRQQWEQKAGGDKRVCNNKGKAKVREVGAPWKNKYIPERNAAHGNPTAEQS